MIRLAWRQFRTPALVALGLLGMIGAFAAITGPNLAHAYATTLTGCRTTGDCAQALAQFARTDAVVRAALGTIVSVVPALLGAFWGAVRFARSSGFSSALREGLWFALGFFPVCVIGSLSWTWRLARSIPSTRSRRKRKRRRLPRMSRIGWMMWRGSTSEDATCGSSGVNSR